MPVRLSAAALASPEEKQDVRGKLATADACRWLPLLSPGSADPRRCLAGRLDRDQLAELDRVPDAGPAAAGWEDQRWTLVRVRDLIGRKFGF